MPPQTQVDSKIPRATYRFQFNEHFRLNDALALVPYLHELGISHIYASPLFAAAPHSLHGYDVCDFSRLNPEVGTEDDLAQLVAALHRNNMGLVLDIVPNHMGIGTRENLWWWDVLKNGRASKFASHFDINWNLSDKILVPILGVGYARILEKGELQLRFENEEMVLRYFENKLPIAPDSLTKSISIEQLNSNRDKLDELIQRQNYRLASWRDGDSELNYRRFFAVSTLAALRVEDEKVFNDVHALVREWYDKGWIDGLRVDHPDGLRDPEQYLQRLHALAPKAWIVVEKILGPGELLPDSWPVAGTTGYDFLNQLAGIFIDPASEKTLTDFYFKFTNETSDYASLIPEKKRAVLKTLLVAEVQRLAQLLGDIAARHKGCKHFTRQQLAEAIIEMAVFLPVYRSYIAPDRRVITETDIENIKHTVRLSCEKRKDIPLEIFALIHKLLVKPQRGNGARDFVYRFQQLTSPAVAKGVEDTAFFCFNRLISLNEVGGDPGKFGVSLENFQKICDHFEQHWPHTMLTTSSHDTKRSEDVRARLNLLSEIPDLWNRTVQKWSAMNKCHQREDIPDRNAEYLFYQTLVGAWPLSVDRALAFMEKAALEAKQHTVWTERNVAYEEALRNFISEAMRDPEFMTDLERFVSTVVDAGRVNSLAQTLIKLTAPGVPDIYQGCELWDFSLVDPDNRRPVDFHLRRRLLAEAKTFSFEKIWKHRSEGLPKMWVIRQVLNLRARQPELFTGDYKALNPRGEKAEHLAAFMRGENMIAIIPRFLLKLNNDWADTTLALPPGNWQSEFTSEMVSGNLCLEDFFQKFPVVLLVRKEAD